MSATPVSRPDAPTTPTSTFSPYVAERLGWYVYALRNPIDGRVFYIGKGKGNRVFAHANDAHLAADEDEVSQKIDVIKKIHQAGQHVNAFIIRHALASEKLAYAVEASLIDLCRLLDPTMVNDLFALTNLVTGHHTSTHGLAGVDVVASLYEAPKAPDITEPALLIKIPVLWTPTISDHDLYNATRQWWRLAAHREKAKYAFAVHRGVIRAVYRINPGSWEPGWFVDDEWTLTPHPTAKRRWRFTGQLDDDLNATYRNTSVKHIYKKGARVSVFYRNC